MKKIIVLFLVAVMCLSLVACGNNADKENTGNNAETNNTQISDKKAEAEKAIIGTWKRDNESVHLQHIVTFNENHTGLYYHSQLKKEGEITWKYDEELSCYIIAGSSEAAGFGTFFMKNDGNTTYLEVGGQKFYRQDK